MFAPKLGEKDPIWLIWGVGWNHQLGKDAINPLQL